MNHRRQMPSPRVREADPWDGILLVDKSSGPTSHDIVDFVRRQFRIPKVGHGGTLDPMATGLLVLLLGRATRLSEYVMGMDKDYEGTMRLGIATNSQDADGEITSERSIEGITREQLEAEIRKRTGDMMQTPPMVSAVKQNGVPLYKLARKGQTVEREPKLIHVYSFELLDFAPPLAWFRLRCTKGTYVRTLCADIGEALGCGAHLRSLHRTASGAFRVEDAVRFEDLTGFDMPHLLERVISLAQLNTRTIHGP